MEISSMSWFYFWGIGQNALSQLDDSTTDVLTALLRNGARQLIAQAVEAELAVLLEEHSSRRLPDGRKALVRNGYLPERSVQTGISKRRCLALYTRFDHSSHK